MTPILDQFLAALIGRGVSLRIRDGGLIYRGPKGAVRAVDRDMLREHRDELFARIAATGPIEPGPEEDPADWDGDERATVRTTDARASIEHHLAAQQAEARPVRPVGKIRRPSIEHERPGEDRAGDHADPTPGAARTRPPDLILNER